jgi:hypothetical protein
MKSLMTLAALGFLLIAPKVTSAESPLPLQSVTVCAIRAYPSAFNNKRVLLRVHLSTDNFSYTFITDEKNGDPKCVMNIQSVARMNDPSVRAFFKAGDDICDKTNRHVVCNLQSDLVTEAIVRLETNGKPYADFQKIISYKYQ